MLLPARRRALLVVALKRLAVVEAVVAEHCAARLKLVSISDQDIPVVMTDLVSEMS
jgi:hypothetical protein